MKPLLVPFNVGRGALGLGRTKTYELVKKGKLTLVKIDNKSLLTTESIEALVVEAVKAAKNDR